ncbi:MAG TPA: hypothetical protein VKY31_14320, partial [Terriglobia bacterium]|nr:hypothetical protein [Terriglobia bacterium]
MSKVGTVRVATEQFGRQEHGKSSSDRLFYIVAAAMMLLLTVVGFRYFYFQGKGIDGGEMTPQILPLVISHGIAMSAWVLLFFVQSLLILKGNRRLHMTLGVAGGVLGILIVVLGMSVAVLSAHYNPDSYKNLGGAKYFLGLMLTEMVAFGTLVGLGILYRRQPHIHRPMMLCATLQLMTGSLSRWPYVEERLFAVSVPLGLYGPMLFF